MANKIAKSEKLEYILKHRRSEDGVQIGNFWSILQIYLCMQNLGVSIATICSIASMIEGRVNSKNQKTSDPINPMMIRKHINLEATPRQISHTTVTKEVSKGVSDGVKEEIKKVLLEHNAYGPLLHDAICTAIDKGKGEMIQTKATTMGNSDFTCVLQTSLLLSEMDRAGFLSDIGTVPNSGHKTYIIKKIKEYEKSGGEIIPIGYDL